MTLNGIAEETSRVFGIPASRATWAQASALALIATAKSPIELHGGMSAWTAAPAMARP
jgi:hypothetical protein